MRSSENFTSVEVTGEPSENFASRRWKVNVFWSELTSQLSARPGFASVDPGMNSTSVSKICVIVCFEPFSHPHRTGLSVTGSIERARRSVPPFATGAVSTTCVPAEVSPALSVPPHAARASATVASARPSSDLTARGRPACDAEGAATLPRTLLYAFI